MFFSNMRKGNRLLHKIISILIVQSFILSGTTFALPNDNIDSLTKQKSVISSPDKIIIAKENGLVKSKFTGNSGKLIIHIQDAHCNFEAQSNIAKIVEGLVKNYNLSLVSVEGADGIIDTSWFKAFPDDDVRNEVATYFMKKGEITGPEFLSITTNYSIKLFGAETREYYIENLNAFTSSYPLKGETEKYYNRIKTALNKLKGFIYSEELKVLDAKISDYESKKIQFNEYIRFLQGEAEKNRVNLREYSDLFKLVSALLYEKKIDFAVTDKERSVLIDELSKEISKDALTDLVTQSLSFKVGKISADEYYTYLKTLALKNNVDLQKRFPNLYNYIIYNSVYSKIENEKLFQDIKLVETVLKEKLFKNDDQRMLDKLSRHIEILLGLVNIKLLNGDFEYYKIHKEEFTHEAFAEFLKKKTIQFGLAYEIEPPQDAVANSIPRLEDFYAIAIKRDNALVNNTLKAMEKEKQDIAVLVTGGFHSEGMAKLFEKQGISYVVVCPTITKDEPTPYIQILTNQRTPLEDILVGNADVKQGMLAPFLISQAVGLSERDADLLGLRARTINIKDKWPKLRIKKWLENALNYASTNKLARDESVMIRAYELAMQNALSAKNSGSLTADDRELIKKITSSDSFNKTFKQIFESLKTGTLGENIAREKVLPARQNYYNVTPDKDLVNKIKASFKLKDVDIRYLLQMWRQYLTRLFSKNKNRNENPLSIIKDKTTIGNIMGPDHIYNPRDGNFILASMLNEKQRKDILGTTSYSDLERDPGNAKAAKKATVTLNSMDGGIGENLRRVDFIKTRVIEEGGEKALEELRKKIMEQMKAAGKDPNKFSDNDLMAAKGLDIGFYIDFQGKKIFVSIAEAKLLRLVEIAKKGLYGKITLQPLVNYQSKESYIGLLDKTKCLYDRYDPSIPEEKKRTYRQFLGDNNIEIAEMLEQADLPGISEETGKIATNPDMTPHQPGGHGNWGFMFLYYTCFEFKPDGETHIRAFYNGDNVNSTVDESIAGAMVRKNWPIIKLVTPAAPIDKKGGKDGIRIAVDDKGNIIYIPDQMEEADAKNAGQADFFYDAGQKWAEGGSEKQPFNTNIIYINTTVLHDILTSFLDQGVVSKEELLDIISPILIKKDAKTKKGGDGKSYIPIDGAIGTAMHRLNAYCLMHKDDPRVKGVLEKYGIDRLLYFVDIPRTKFFTPTKKTYDMWLQGWSDYYKPFSPDDRKWSLEDTKKGLVPPELDLLCGDPNERDKKDPTKKVKREKRTETYWHELQNLIDSFGNASTVDLGSLTVDGRIAVKNATLKGTVAIILDDEFYNKKDENGKPLAVDLVKLLKENKIPDNYAERVYFENGALVLKNIQINIDKDYNIKYAAPLPLQFSAITNEWAPGKEGQAIRQREAPEFISQLIENKWVDTTGDAITITGAALTPEQNKMVNEIIRKDFEAGNARFVEMVNKVAVYEIPGLEECDSFLIAHPGRGGEVSDHRMKRRYMSPARLKWMKSLSPAAQAQIEEHEAGHIKMKNINPHVTEAEVQKAYPINLVLEEAINMEKIETAKMLNTAKTEIENYLTTQYKKGSISKEIYDKALAVTYKNLESWVKDPAIQRISPNTKAAILEAIKQNRWKDIVEVFRQDITFGTAGIRGLAALTKEDLELLAKDGPGANILKGPNTINDIVLLLKTAGVIKYAMANKMHKVVIGYDSRIAGRQFAELIARSFIANSTKECPFTVYLFDEASPFPELSFAVTTKAVRADLGILISASHNPSNYNGYKITNSTGAQLTGKMRDAIVASIAGVTTDDIKLKDLSEAVPGELIWLGGQAPIDGKDYKGVDLSRYFIDMHTMHVDQVKKFIIDKETVKKFASQVKIGFAAFNGAGNVAVPRMLKELGFIQTKTISSLQKLDGTFPAFGWGEQPDPGDPIAAGIAAKEFVKEYGQEAFDELDVLIGTDPDADRAGFTVKTKVPESQKKYFGEYKLLSANDAWTLLVWYRLEREKELNGRVLPDADKKYITFSHVTTDALEKVAGLYGVKSLGEMLNKRGVPAGDYLNGRRSWVGFSLIAEYCAKARAEGLINVGGAEESNGFSILGGPITVKDEILASNGHVNDKDGTFAALLLAEVAAYAKSKNTTFFELLDNIYLNPGVGYFATANKPLPRVGSFAGAEGVTKKMNLLKTAQGWMREANDKAKTNNPFVLAGLPVIGAIEFKTGKYDSQHYEGFPDEGIRFFFEDKDLKSGEPFQSSRNYITIRPSGTSQTIRFYTQAFAAGLNQENIGELKYETSRKAEALALQAQAELLTASGYNEDVGNISGQMEAAGYDPKTVRDLIKGRPALKRGISEVKEEPREKYINDKYVKQDSEGLAGTISTLALNPSKLQNTTVIFLSDTDLEPRAEMQVETSHAARAGEAAVNRYLGGALINIRGTGKPALEKLREVRAEVLRLNDAAREKAKKEGRAVTNEEIRKIVIATAAGNRMLKELNAEEKEELGKTLHFDNKGERHIPVIGMYDLVLRVAYEFDDKDILECLNRIATTENGQAFTKADLDRLLKGDLVILPRIIPKDGREAVEAHNAEQQALKSL